MNLKITTLFSVFIFALFMGCSGGDDSGSNCGKVESVSFNAFPTSVRFSIIPGNNATSFKFEYGPTGFRQGTGISMVTSDTQVDVKDLTPETTYDFYITGMCGAGEISASKLLSVTTQQSQCTGTTSVEFAQFYPNEIELQFSYTGGFREYYEVEYGIAGFTLGTGTRVATSIGNSSKTITGIQASTTYDFYVRSHCTSDENTPFVKFSFRTMSGCPKPFNLNSWNISGSCNSGSGETRAFSWSYLAGTPQSYTISIVQGATDNPATGNTFTTSATGISISNMYCNWNAFYVKANCTGTDSSEWAGPYYF